MRDDLPILVVPFLAFGTNLEDVRREAWADPVALLGELRILLLHAAHAAGEENEDQIYMILRSLIFSVGNIGDMGRLQRLADVVAAFDRDNPLPPPPAEMDLEDPKP